MNHTSTSRITASLLGILASIGMPLVSSAAGSDLFTVGQDSADKLLAIFQTLTQVAFLAILVFFFWGLAKYIFGGAEDKIKGKNLMIWGVLAIFVAASIWGIVAVLKTTFGVGDEQAGVVPIVI